MVKTASNNFFSHNDSHLPFVPNMNSSFTNHQNAPNTIQNDKSARRKLPFGFQVANEKRELLKVD